MADYDSDGDGVIDQVFVYYAGNNEAEGANENTIWPHRSAVLSNASGNNFGGIKAGDYACSSELRGANSSVMCGIGTFVHEFGHILGLPDLYDIYYSGHATLDAWDVMDAGCYLNNGCTPAGYSAYERFFLGWCQPELINSPLNDTLAPLITGNQARLICQGNYHNMRGSNPNPRLFYLIENRQQTGWDTYLPAHGLLITRVNYSASRWYSNTVNTNANAMGVDIIEANGVRYKLNGSRNYLGDPFPGTAGISTFDIVFSDSIHKPLSEISEAGGSIFFKFMGGIAPAPNAIGEVQNDEIAVTVLKEKIIVTCTTDEPVAVQIFSLQGQKLCATTTSNRHCEIDLALLPHGIYLLRTGEKVRKILL